MQALSPHFSRFPQCAKRFVVFLSNKAVHNPFPHPSSSPPPSLFPGPPPPFLHFRFKVHPPRNHRAPLKVLFASQETFGMEGPSFPPCTPPPRVYLHNFPSASSFPKARRRVPVPEPTSAPPPPPTPPCTTFFRPPLPIIPHAKWDPFFFCMTQSSSALAEPTPPFFFLPLPLPQKSPPLLDGYRA